MKTRLMLIAVAAAAFGWGFAFLVERTGQIDRSQTTSGIPCQEWAGNGCSRAMER